MTSSGKQVLTSVKHLPGTDSQSSYFSQTLQGADILAKTLGAQIFMPDFFGENVFNIKKFPPKNEQEKQDLQNFFGTIATPDAIATKLVDFAEVLKGDGFKKIGALGYCFGNVQTTFRSSTRSNWVLAHLQGRGSSS